MSQLTRQQQAAALEKDWSENPRWKGIKRGYSAEDVVRLRGSLNIEHTLAKRGAEKLWNLVNTEPFVNTLGALTGNQAMQQVKAGLKAIYLSGWQVAGDANTNGEMYPDQSLSRAAACCWRVSCVMRCSPELLKGEVTGQSNQSTAQAYRSSGCQATFMSYIRHDEVLLKINDLGQYIALQNVVLPYAELCCAAAYQYPTI